MTTPDRVRLLESFTSGDASGRSARLNVEIEGPRLIEDARKRGEHYVCTLVISARFAVANDEWDLSTDTRKSRIDYRGVTPFQALGRALIAADSAIAFRAHLGPFTTSAGLQFDAAKHSAIRLRELQLQILARESFLRGGS